MMRGMALPGLAIPGLALPGIVLAVHGLIVHGLIWPGQARQDPTRPCQATHSHMLSTYQSLACQAVPGNARIHDHPHHRHHMMMMMTIMMPGLALPGLSGIAWPCIAWHRLGSAWPHRAWSF